VKLSHRLLIIAILFALLLPLASCQRAPEGPTVLSLDWVPNTNHTGIYVALDKGWYQEEGIELEVQIPADPSAAIKQVAAGNTAFGVSFQEEVTLARANDIPVVSIAAVIQHNTSAYAALAESGIASATDFEGKTYASYGLPIERPILDSLMACAGADPSQVTFIDVGFDAFPALLTGKVDLAWIFMGWDGIQAQIKGIDLNTVPLYGSCVPDYYTPVLIAGEKTLKNEKLVTAFLKATARGYAYAAEHPEEAAEILLTYSPESGPELVRASQAWISPRYQDDAARWGEQNPAIWSAFADWMFENDLLPQAIDTDQAFTNAYLPD